MPYRIIVTLSLFLAFPATSLADEHTEQAPAAEHRPESATPPPKVSTDANAVSKTNAHSTVVNDTRIVIDTSGSMKQTDPKNLRIPALKLLVNLLPTGDQAGVWAFDTRAQELVPLGTISTNWKAQAELAANRINSKGQFTHIEAALIAASQDWTDAAPAGAHRNLILLTDGMVDISKNAEESATSRERILTEILPRLQQAGVQVFTIALSAQSDQELMRQIALSTGGWNEIAETAEQLQRTFLQMFNKSTPHDSVPLKDNQFHVDASIDEFTVLVMLPPNAKPTRFLAPDRTEISGEHKVENVHWLHDTGYDLVTVSHPAPGDWKLVADVDPANQVMVVTNLKMQPGAIPNYVTVEEKPEISAAFTENGQPIQREEFLSLLTLKAELTGVSATNQLPMPRDASNPASFHAEIQSLPSGDYNVLIRADGKTFQREARLSFKVLESLLKVETAPDPSTEPPGLSITLTPNEAAIAPESLKLQATLTDQSHKSQVLNPERHENSWQIKLPAPKSEDRWVVNFQASAKTPDGLDLAIPLKPLPLNGAEEHAPIASAAPHPNAPPDWPMTGAITGAINAIALLVGWLIYRMMKKRNDATVAQLLSRLTN